MNTWRNRIDRRNFLRAAAAFAATSSLGACRGEQDAVVGEQTEDRYVATTVFRNGLILPVDAGFTEQQALAVRGSRILAIGSEDAVLSAAGSNAKIVDLAGRIILPGFIEPHMHFALMAGIGHFPDIGPFKYPTFDAALQALREISAQTPPDHWVTARQFDPILLEPVRDLTIRELDEVAPDHPVWILNASGHIAYVNSRALKLAGITANAAAPAGGEYGRFEDGTPNGILYGPDAHLPVLLLNQEVAERFRTGFVDAGIAVGELSASLGITTLCDQAAGGLAGNQDLTLYRQMMNSGRMKTRLRASLFDQQAADWEEAGIRFGDGDDMFRIVNWKMVTDGSNQGFTGRQREPYVNSDSVGLFYIEPEELKEKVRLRTSQGWPLALHGNGDAAIDSILDAMEAAQAAGIDVTSLRCRIEHCSILHDDQIERIAALKMGPSFLINHVHYWGHVMRDRVFGPEKVQLLDRCRAVEDAGITWTIHTDAPVSPLGCLHKIRVAVARDLWKEPETVLAPQEKVSVEAAIRAVTTNAAWQCHSEDVIGSLESGKLADLVILDADPRKVEPTAISDINVSETWLDGVKVYG